MMITIAKSYYRYKLMEVEKVFHMNGGNGKTSYARNSQIQKELVLSTKAVWQDAGMKVYSTVYPNTIRIADLGCSTGENTLLIASDVIELIDLKCRQLGHPPPELLLFLNDLPMNDFNATFRFFAKSHLKWQSEIGVKYPIFISGVPGSFYRRLFPKKSLNLVHSSSSLHWLSQVPAGLHDRDNLPLNKGKIYISATSPCPVSEAYHKQFKEDFSSFLKCRAEEIVAGGYMVLAFMYRRCEDASAEYYYQWELLAQALMQMANEGLIEAAKVDTFNAPFYAPSIMEVKHEIESEGSFTVDQFHTWNIDLAISQALSVDYFGGRDDNIEKKGLTSQCAYMVKTMRACTESLLLNEFGEDIIEEVFDRYSHLMEDYMSKNKAEVLSIIVSLVRTA